MAMGMVLDGSRVRLRPWRDGDDLELMQLWPDAENVQASVFRAKLGPDADQPWQRSVVVEHQGVPVAAGTVYETSLHSQRLWCYVEVAPDHRRAGLAARGDLMAKARIANLARLRHLFGRLSGASAGRTRNPEGVCGA